MPSTNGRIVLRDYQEASIDHLYGYFQEHNGHPIIALPTGTGKSIIIAEFTRRALMHYEGTQVIMLTHVKELIEQNLKTLLKAWPTAPAGVYSAGLGRREHRPDIVFAGIQSVYKKAKLFGHVDLVLVDECHLISPKGTTMYRRFLKALWEINPLMKVVGFSATPFRLGQGMLTDHDQGIFTDIAFDLTSREAFNWLIAQGWIAPLIPKQPTAELDISGVRIQGGEFVLKDLQEHVDRETVTRAALLEAVRQAGNRKHWLVFASGIEHAEHISNMLNDEFGVTASFVHSQISDDERTQRLRDFKSGKIQAMVNNNILTTGFDYPDIDCIVMLRPTASPGLWVQMLGRGTRPVYADGYDLSTPQGRVEALKNGPKRNCIVLDFAGNTKRLGPINDPVLPRKRGKGAPGTAPVRLCEHCGAYSHASARFCENPECGQEFPKTIRISAEASIQQIIAGLVPEIHTFPVTKVTYHVHKKEGKPDSMCVTYYSGLRRFKEYICLDHGGYATRVAKQWWEMRSPWGAPPSVHEGMKAIDYLKQPKAIQIVEKGKYPEICGYDFA